MIRRPPRSTRTDTLFPYTTLFRSALLGTERNDNFGFRIEVDVEAPLIVAGERTTQPWHAAAAGVAVRAWIARGFDKLLDDMGWCRTVGRSEEHTSELQSLMRISYAVFCLKKKKEADQTNNTAMIH